jgi:hypothetical protein
MASRFALSLALLPFLAAPALSQVSSIVGPQVAPLGGCPIAISISNDTTSTVWTGICPYTVKDGVGNVVYTPICIAIALQIVPGGTFTANWPQIDNNGSQVLAGLYQIEVSVPGVGIQKHPVVIGGTDAGVAPLGVPKIGTTRKYRLCAPLDGGFNYLLLGSGSTTSGIPTCGGLFPLDPDAIMNIAVSDPTIFINLFGTLASDGSSSDPALAIPLQPHLIGVNIFWAFLVIDFNAPCPFPRISSVLQTTIS